MSSQPSIRARQVSQSANNLIAFSTIEVYRFLASEVRAYLPPIHTCPVWHLRELCSNQRTLLRCDDVRVIMIPLFEGLYVEDLLQFGTNQD